MLMVAACRRAVLSMGMLLWSCCRRRATAMASDSGYQMRHGNDISRGDHFTSRSSRGQAGTCGGENHWVTYLLVSPTRSSIAGYALRSDVDGILRWHNGEESSEHPKPPAETELLRPWSLAEMKVLSSESQAATKAWQVSHQSGFRARLTAMRKEGQEAANRNEALPLEKALDALTYVQIEFCSPKEESRCVKVLALVDTGSNDCDLKGSLIDELGLPVAKGGGTSVETAANRVVEIPIYQAKLRVQGRECIVKVSPADEDYAAIGGGVSTLLEDDVDKEFDFGTTTDEAVIGADALASLGLVVDCKRRRLLEEDRLHDLPSVDACPRASRSNCMHVRMGFRKADSEKAIMVKALVDSGSTDVDLEQSKIRALDLVVDDSEIPALFETAGGVTTSAPIYWAIAKLGDREAPVRLSPSFAEEDSEDEDSSDEDEEALLGHDALAALNLLVDCKNRRLLMASDEVKPGLAQPEEQGLQKRRRREHADE